MDTKTSGIEGLSAVVDRRAGNRDLVGEEDLERLRREIQPPTTVTETGRHAEYGYADFFKAKVGNANPRKPYKLAVDRFLFSCREHGFGLRDATSFVIGDYLETYLTDKDRRPLASRSKKQHLTSLRHVFDNQRMFHGIGIKPALSVRGPKYSAHDGKPPAFGKRKVKTLLNSIQASDVVSVRDKTLLIVLVGTAARASALARLRKVDYYSDGTQSSFSFDDKGGKLHVVPARHDLQLQMKSYIKAAESKGQPDKSPLFPTAKKKKRSRRSRADGDSRSATKKVHQHESRSTRHRARGTRGGHGGVVGRMALA